ncbi:MAG TPA: bifunctional UDP-N-acetylglucosamine diphosphorylase/glucosamine-1-phosphate N-acetyltransferase GlmU [Bryobacteraceae bacterium]|nr:bifunctional UDP-N-acetylglucosamine diphosphorylase/glucosamine-1-phosphate N-acetyltransferase GlmU [Bryobacteraceae bacterium]
MVNDAAVAILAAGQGTRMKSRMAKVLHRAGGKALVEHVIGAAKTLATPERIFVVVGHQAEAVGEVARANGVQSILQAEQLGTGHAVMCGKDQLAGLGGLLLVLNGDCPMIRPETLERLVDLYRSSGSAAAMITTDLDDPTGYGRIIRQPNGDVQAIVEHKAATPEQLAVREINVGFYCFDAAAFWKHVHEIRPDNPASEYYLTDMIAILLKAGHRVTALKAEDSSEMLGINNRVELAAVDRILRERKTRQLMLEGVTIERPETVTIDADVTVGMDTVIGPFTQIMGKTTIGENCRIGASSILDNATLGDNVDVFPFSMVSASTLDNKAQIGPFARLRMGAHLAEDAHVGNFVELKKTKLGAGSKSMHLAYLGDSTIGSKVNIGAGTITCNYDGQKKHPTQIADGAFVGSNSTLVAPISIAEDAYIAAGSVITHPVPAKTLALGRAHQVMKEGWKPKLKS